MLYYKYTESVTKETLVSTDSDGSIHWLYPMSRIDGLIYKLRNYTKEEILLALECCRSLKEFEIDEQDHLYHIWSGSD